MSEEVADEDQPVKHYVLPYIEADLHAGHITYLIGTIIEEASKELAANTKRIIDLLQYLAGTYYTANERRKAEVELLQLQRQREDLEAKIRNALVIAPDLNRPVTINT